MKITPFPAEFANSFCQSLNTLRLLSSALTCVMVSSEIDLRGEWVGYYSGHFDEVVRISQDGDQVEAVKITGDDFVPAGEVTWRADLKTGHGQGQIAEREFRNPRFIPGRLTIMNREKILFQWERCGWVEYRRDE
jgi:hypothetical protein